MNTSSIKYYCQNNANFQEIVDIHQDKLPPGTLSVFSVPLSPGVASPQTWKMTAWALMSNLFEELLDGVKEKNFLSQSPKSIIAISSATPAPVISRLETCPIIEDLCFLSISSELIEQDLQKLANIATSRNCTIIVGCIGFFPICVFSLSSYMWTAKGDLNDPKSIMMCCQNNRYGSSAWTDWVALTTNTTSKAPSIECDHDYVNVGFNSIKIVCKYCDQDKPK